MLRFGTTTSVRDSGLLDRLLPPFEDQQQIRVELIIAGTGKVLKLAEMGDVDVVFVHARQAEEAFMAAGHGVRREEVMANRFELLGPPDDPAQVRGLEANGALQKIASAKSPFISRGDDSGTHKRELMLWETRPEWSSYRETGQGMGATLIIANELSAYVLADRGTYLNFREKIDLVPLAKQTDALLNPYGAIVVKPESPAATHLQLAQQLVDYLISPAAQQIIANYQIVEEQLFTPVHSK